MLNARSIQGIAVLIIGTFLAIWLGIALVTNQLETILQVSVGALLLICALLGHRIWLLLILFTSMNVALWRWLGSIDVGQMLFIGFSLALFLMRKLRFELKIRELEVWVILISLCIVQAYMRNPVGMHILGSGSVGGRPYFVLALAITSAAILSTLIVPPKELKWALRLSLFGGFLGIPLQMARTGSLTTTSAEDMSRIPTLATCANLISRWVSSRLSPLRACFHPLWALVILASIAMAAASGYRNSVAAIGFIYLAGIFYHGGFRSFMGSLLLGSFALLMLAFINLNFPLPGNMQRALSPLPGSWEEQYIASADQSTEWRVEMWKEALFTDRWIQNKFLGDGIGMTAAQLDQNENLAVTRGGKSSSGLLIQQENMLASGSYHSGPVHSVRMVGYVGLLILLLAMIRVAVHAHRQILRCKGTEWSPVALFFGIPLIIHPFFFIFVFGEYHTAVAQMTLGLAMVRLMERNIPLPAYVVNHRRVHVPLAVRDRAGEVQNARSV